MSLSLNFWIFTPAFAKAPARQVGALADLALIANFSATLLWSVHRSWVRVYPGKSNLIQVNQGNWTHFSMKSDFPTPQANRAFVSMAQNSVAARQRRPTGANAISVTAIRTFYGLLRLKNKK